MNTPVPEKRQEPQVPGLPFLSALFWLVAVACEDGVVQPPPVTSASSNQVAASVAQDSDRDVLVAIYEATGGPQWNENENWLTDAPLNQWHGVVTDTAGNVTGLDLADNFLEGPIPPQLGSLEHLVLLDLFANRLYGPIPSDIFDLSGLTYLQLGKNQLGAPLPPEIAQLGNLYFLSIDNSQLGGPIPSELGNLASLQYLFLHGNDLTGEIPEELGGLGSLQYLFLHGNDLTGEIPEELGGLGSLQYLFLHGNDLTGEIPEELGGLDSLRVLFLSGNDLTDSIPPALGDLGYLQYLNMSGNALEGPIPEELSRLANLLELSVANNFGLSGPLPDSLVGLDQLEVLRLGRTSLCAPSDTVFAAWLEGIPDRRVARCVDGGTAVHLTQAVQSLEFPVPLVAGRPALLRAFVSSENADGEMIPAVRATFYVNGTQTHVADIAEGSAAIPTEIDEGALPKSANVEIPAEVIRPGLEMVIEVDPDSTLDSELGIPRRIPGSGRMTVDVREMPPFELTLIPFLYTEDPDSSVLEITAGMAADPEGHAMLEGTRTLLPIDSLVVTRHDPVETDVGVVDSHVSSEVASELLTQTKLIRLMEAGSGYWQGMLTPVPRLGGVLGLAYLAGWSSFVTPSTWPAMVIAHEFGHNMSLYHAPCGGAAGSDPLYPDPNGRIASWGYDRDKGTLISPYTPDLMTYCGGEAQWIGEFSFAKSLRHRLDVETPGAATAASTRSLLVWGGLNAEGEPFLEPAFIADATPSLPRAGGEFLLRGSTEAGTEAFSLRFDMPEVLHAEDESSGFVFAVPVTWSGTLASIELVGGDEAVTLDRNTDRPMSISFDRVTGQVRAILRGPPSVVAADAEGAAGLPDYNILFSRGIPEEADQGR